MTGATINGFVDELEKISERLTKEEKRDRALKFTAIGTLSGPAISGAAGAIKGGQGSFLKNITQGTKLRRWAPATMATGALVSGAVPAVRHAVERDILEGARERRALARKLEAQNAG